MKKQQLFEVVMKVYTKQDYDVLLKIYESISDIQTDELMRLSIERFGTTQSLHRAGLIDLTQEPTHEQYFVLRQFMRMNSGDAYVDITDEIGNTIHSFYYEKAVPSRLVNDLNQYFTEGVKPLGDG